jgi:hypothetical protein
MTNGEKLNELLAKREKLVQKISYLKKNLGHPHGDWQSAHDLAESDYKVYVALLEDVDEQIIKLSKKGPEV